MAEISTEYTVCPYCGYVVGTPAEEAIHLSPGSKLHGRFLVGKVLGYGGFGVTYIGWDELLEQKVAIKEYLPSEFSTRMPGQTQVTVFNGEKEEQFRDGMKKFVDEAKRLAKFHHEDGIVQIYDSFEENSTAYIVMEYLEGETLKEYLDKMGTMPEDDAVALLMPVMTALKAVHAEGILHRDIAPDNIFLTNDGKVKLIDFGASRYATTSHSRSLTVIIKPGYSPEEQYRSRGDQGPYTDVYSLSATLYKMITGATPPDAMERRAKYEGESKDILVEPHKLNKKISVNRENAILNALNVRIEDRTQDIDQFIEELQADPPVKRRYGKIKKIDILRWPLWAKIVVPTAIGVFVILSILMATGVINFSRFTQKITIPDGVVVVPEVEGMASDDAIKEIENGQLLAVTAGTVESEYIEAGTIVLQNPIGGSYADVMSKVMLTVSSGGEVKEAVDGISTVPYVIWDSLEDAKEKLKTAGLGDPETTEEYDENVEEGHVISQSIAAGEEVEEGTIIKLVISKGPAPFAMPDVTGQMRQAATETLTNLGLTVSVDYETNRSVAEDSVLRQSISQGTNVRRGDTVILTVASRSETVTVPNVTGMSQTDAVRTLEDQGLSSNVLFNYSDTVANGNVIYQTPAGGTYQVKGTSVTIYVSQGRQQGGSSSGGSSSATPGSTKVTVPDVTGKTLASARTTLTNLGLKVTTEEVFSDSVPSGSIVSQSPAGGSSVDKNSTIRLQISKGKEQGSSQPIAIVFDVRNGSIPSQYRPNPSVINYTYEPGSLTGHIGEPIGALPVPTAEGLVFNHWYVLTRGKPSSKAVNSGTVIEDSWEISNNTITLYASWDSDSNYHALYYDDTLGKMLKAGQPFGGLPDVSSYYTVVSGASLLGWCDNNNTSVDSNTLMGNTDVHLSAIASTVIYFDANGGSCSVPSKTYYSYGLSVPVGDLPIPERNNYHFDGWYTSDGTPIYSETKFSPFYYKEQDLYINSFLCGSTLYAHWTPVESQLSANIYSCYYYEEEGDWAGTWWLHFECNVNSNYKLITLALNIDGINRDYRSCADQNTASTVYWGNIPLDIEPPSIGPHTISVITTDESGKSVQSDIVVTYSGE